MTPSPATRTPLFWLGSLIFAAFLWGASFPLVKIMAGAFPPITLAALRGLGGALTLILWFSLRKESILPRSGRELLEWAMLGALNGWIANLLVSFALQTLPSGQAAMIQSCGPLITALIATQLFADERLTWRKLTGILIGMGGVALLIGPRLFGSGATPVSTLAMVGVALCYATGNIFVRLLKVADPKRLALGQQLTSAFFASIFALSFYGAESFAPAMDHIWPIIALGSLGTAAPIAIYMAVLRAIGPTKGSLTGYLVPAWAVIVSAITLGEAVGLREIAAGIIILTGVYVVTAAKNR